MIEKDINDIEIVDCKEQRINLKWSKGAEKLAIVNFSTQKFDSKFGKSRIKAQLDTQQVIFKGQSQSRKKDNKKQINNLKFSVQYQHKRNKIFQMIIPKIRGVKKNNESKVHFLLQISRGQSLLSVVDDYAEAKMIIRGGRGQKLKNQESNPERKRIDGRKKQSDEQLHKDPDFAGDGDQNSE